MLTVENKGMGTTFPKKEFSALALLARYLDKLGMTKGYKGYDKRIIKV